MKQVIIFTVAALFLFAFITPLPVRKGYAYQRAVLPATRTGGLSEQTGEESSKPVKANVSFLIYLETNRAQNIKPSIAWIRGSAYKITAEKIKDHSVVITRMNNSGNDDTLVKKTANAILKISPLNIVAIKAPAAIMKKITKTNVVIEYYWNGNKYYYTISQIKKLEPLTLE